jgi:sialate O-acetylesterase
MMSMSIPSHLRLGLLSLSALLLLSLRLAGAVQPAGFFGEGMVLQRGETTPVWGTAAPHEKVKVRFADQECEGVADARGQWSVALRGLAASGRPGTLTVSAGTARAVELSNILVGDVWLCSGQSNMVMPLARMSDGAEETAAATHPAMRLFAVARAVSDAPAADVKGTWAVCSPKSAGMFSAVAYVFGRELHAALGVPIGLVSSCWGATRIESWMSQAALDAFPEMREAQKQWQKVQPKLVGRDRDESGKPDNDLRLMPAGLYHAMIHPLTPAAVRGVIWYQGEANEGQPGEYARQFPAMIQQWRAAFAQPHLPFYFVQLPNFSRSSDPAKNRQWAYLREAQTQALKLPATGMAVTIDVGEDDAIHPKNKLDVGRRLARVALAGTYGRPLEASGPVVENIAREGPGYAIRFRHAAGLQSKIEGLPGFEIAGADRLFHPAVARIEGDRVIVSSPAVPGPIAVRYAWRNTPAASLFNASGLPAAPFRSDDW